MKNIKLLWLERLVNNMESAKSIRLPVNEQEGISHAFMLMAYSINSFNNEIVKKFRGASKSRIQLEINKILAQFNRLDNMWSNK